MMCDEVLLAGKVARPRFSDLKLDAKGVMMLPQGRRRPRARATMRCCACWSRMFEDEGFKAVGVAEAAPSLVAGEGRLGSIAPSPDASRRHRGRP